MTKSLNSYNTLTFDCYGTLIDWESGIWDALQPVLMDNECEVMTRNRALAAFGRVESRQQSETPDLIYTEVLSRVHRDICREYDLKTSEQLDHQFGQSVFTWPAFPDSADALRRLKTHYKLVILSNVNRAGFAASNRRLGVSFDAIYTAEDVGSYKPDVHNFEFMLERLHEDLGVQKKDILHTAQSLFHDHVPASTLGLATAWIDRQGLSETDNWGATARVEKRPHLDFIFPTMQAMSEAVDGV